MSTLLVVPLEDELSQEIRFNLNTRVQVAAIIPYILMFNSPAGTFTLSLSKGPATIYAKTFTSDDIKAALDTTDGNAHVFLPFVPSDLLQVENGLYVLKITSSGYAPTGVSYLGWIQQFEDVQNEMDYIPSDDTKNSLAYRIKKHKEGIE